jgi:hypothetical protein
MSGQKVPFKIFACDVSKDGVITARTKAGFVALINPKGYGHNSTINYSQVKVMGKAGAEAKFFAIKQDKLTLEELVLDGTGAVPGTTIPVKSQVEALRDTVHNYIGSKHQSPIVRVVWGSLIFYGRVQGMKVDYTLFMPSGEPLRARVKLDFVAYDSAAQLAKEEKRGSPDLTHLVLVKAGDTLPLLCEKIYSDSAYYLEVARINGLTAFRELVPGTSLRFPPLG